jgi:hypothetical protein
MDKVTPTLFRYVLLVEAMSLLGTPINVANAENRAKYK